MKQQEKRLFVLDTNVLMADPTAIFRFQEHDIYLPMVVLEELDAHKTGPSDLARNVRQTNRMLVDLMGNFTHPDIVAGLPIPNSYESGDGKPCSGRLFFQTQEFHEAIPTALPGNKADNTILATCIGLKKHFKNHALILVSKDINLRIKASILGITAEDYYSDHVLDNRELLHSGYHILPEDFWETHGKHMQVWKENGHSYYRLSGPLTAGWVVNDFLQMPEAENYFQARVVSIDKDEALIALTTDYTHKKNSVWGIIARNIEQNFALNALMDPEIDFVSLQGIAGTGKTLLALAAGLHQVFEDRRYKEVIFTRITVPVGEDIGFLPGTEEEKMAPWMGALMDNLEILHGNHGGGESNWATAATQEWLKDRIKVCSMNFMRGRTFVNRFVIIDEAQNLTPKQMKTLVTRSGPGTKFICLGDVKQIDTPYITEMTSGLAYVAVRFRGWEHGAHVTLMKGERSRLTDFAAENL
jgi:PhoH-like ATPase